MLHQERSNVVFRSVALTLSLARTERQRYILAKLITFISSSSASLGVAIAMALHTWTVILAFNHKGLRSAIVTSLLPVLSELFWLFAHGSYVGTFFNLYSYGVIGAVGLLYVLNRLKPIDVHAGHW